VFCGVLWCFGSSGCFGCFGCLGVSLGVLGVFGVFSGCLAVSWGLLWSSWWHCLENEEIIFYDLDPRRMLEFGPLPVYPRTVDNWS
jgi:hypothetical protein